LARTLVIGLLWLLFVALWYRVYGITTIVDITNAITYLVSVVSVYGLLVTAWVLHNIAIFRRKGPRRGVRMLDYSAIHDKLGSYIVAAGDVKEQKAITVSVSDGRKVFREIAL
jgi:hypothetical protein